MGIDHGQILFVGVKLASVAEMFGRVREEKYGCEHEVDDHKFCPECGRISKRTVTREVPKVELADGWQYKASKPVINDDLFMYYNYEDEVYVGVYSKLEYTPGPAISLSEKHVAALLKKRIHLMRFLEKHNIKIEPDSFGIHAIPYLSC